MSMSENFNFYPRDANLEDKADERISHLEAENQRLSEHNKATLEIKLSLFKRARVAEARAALLTAACEALLGHSCADPSEPCHVLARAALSPEPKAEACEEEYRILRWTCESCGWSGLFPMPGFAGTGLKHYENGRDGCGPLVARCVGFARAHPGAPREELVRIAAAEGAPPKAESAREVISRLWGERRRPRPREEAAREFRETLDSITVGLAPKVEPAPPADETWDTAIEAAAKEASRAVFSETSDYEFAGEVGKWVRFLLRTTKAGGQ